MNYLKISIITPNLNQGKYLEDNIQSVIHQKYPNVEHIIIDGGSNDCSLSIIKKYQNYLHYWISEKDDGQSNAINKGLKLVSGDIILWLNSDDKLNSNALHIVNDTFIKNNDIDILCGSSYIFNNFTRHISYPTQNDFYLQLLSRMPTPQPSCFFKKNVIEKNGLLNTQLHYAMDMEYLCRAHFINGFKFTFTDNILSWYRFHSDSKTISNTLKFANEWAIVFYSYLEKFGWIDELNKIANLKLFNFDKKIDIPEISSHIIKLYESNKSKIFAYFLLYQSYFYHRCNEFDKSRKILTFLKNNYYSEYKNLNIKKYYFSVKYLPDFIHYFKNYGKNLLNIL